MVTKLTVDEYLKLRSLLDIVKDKGNSRGIRRLAMAEFDFLYKNREELKSK